MDPAEILLMLLGFGSILFLAFITTRYIGNRAGKAMMGKHVTIIETVSLGTDKRLHLVRAGEQYLLIASTSKSVEFISEIRLDQAEEVEKTETAQGLQNVFDFKSIFEKYAGIYKNKKVKKTGFDEMAADEIKPKGINFRNNLDRLRVITRGYEKKDLKNEDENTNEK